MRFALWNMVMRAAEDEEGAGETPPEGEVTPPVTPVADPPPAADNDWALQRINKLTARLREAEARETQLRAQIPTPSTSPTVVTPVPTPDIDSLVEQRAAAMQFDSACMQVANAGRQQFGQAEFNSRVNDILTKVVDRSDPASLRQYNTFLQATMDVGNAAGLIYDLGANPAEMTRILALSPTKMAVELQKMADKRVTAEAEPPQTQPSGAPRPIQPIVPRTAQHTPITPSDPTRAGNLSTAEWMRRRQEEVAAARQSGRRLQ